MKTSRPVLSVLLAACLLLCCAPPALADTPSFSDAASAAAHIRAAMCRREAVIPFIYTVPRERIGEMTVEGISAFFKEEWRRIDKAVFAHTGVGREGDYLEKHLEKHGYDCHYDYSPQAAAVVFHVTETVAYYTTAAQEDRVTAAVADALRQLNLNGKSDYEKIRAINCFICDRVTYDDRHLNDSAYRLPFSAYAALINGTAVCQGYAALVYRMALEAGVDCRIITGRADNGSGIGDHSWNIVRLGGQYYYLDVTWNDATASDRYLLIGRDGFQEHFPADEFTGGAFAAACPIADRTFRPGDAAQPVRRGDVDGDGWVTAGDARLALRASIRLESYAPVSLPYAAADVDGNGVIEASDARAILRVSVGLDTFA